MLGKSEVCSFLHLSWLLGDGIMRRIICLRYCPTFFICLLNTTFVYPDFEFFLEIFIFCPLMSKTPSSKLKIILKFIIRH
jgi:hypothetical protein